MITALPCPQGCPIHQIYKHYNLCIKLLFSLKPSWFFLVWVQGHRSHIWLHTWQGGAIAEDTSIIPIFISAYLSMLLCSRKDGWGRPSMFRGRGWVGCWGEFSKEEERLLPSLAKGSCNAEREEEERSDKEAAVLGCKLCLCSLRLLCFLHWMEGCWGASQPVKKKPVDILMPEISDRLALLFSNETINSSWTSLLPFG